MSTDNSKKVNRQGDFRTDCTAAGKPAISVIVPVYGTEPWLPDCLDSILSCRGIPLEVLVIDDCSPGDAGKICRKYMEKDSRVRFLRNLENRGLLMSRLRGVQEAAAEYVAFVDSDDRIGPGYLAGLYETAVRTGADIVIGRTVRVSGQKKELFGLHENSLHSIPFRGEEARNAFFEQEGRCYAWHTVWNKLYRKSCWEASLQWFTATPRKITMCEDLCLSFQIFAQAPTVYTSFGSPYYYCERKGAQTSTGGDTTARILEKLEEVCTSFEEAEDFMCSLWKGDPGRQKLMGHFYGCRKYYGRIWGQILGSRILSGPQKQYAAECLGKLAGDSDSADLPDNRVPGPGYYEKIRIPYSERTDYLEQRIMEGPETCISFDVFDTLVTRPFGKPQELFVLLDPLYSRLTGSSAPFHRLREEAEKRCRHRLFRDSGYGDVTIYEIYEQLRQDCGIESDVLRRMREEEEGWELRCAMPRETGRRLLQAAVRSGKKVILVTDMYLSDFMIRRILDQCGIPSSLPLYISSEVRKLKGNGELFRAVRRREKLPGNRILHIGDNWQADMMGARKAGINCLYLPSPGDSSRGVVRDQPPCRRGHFGARAFGQTVWEKACRDPRFSAARGMAVHRYWDDPYRDLPEETGFGGDPFYLGYCLLGPLLLGILQNILKEAGKRDSREVVFLERDADLPLRAMQILSETVPGIPPCRGMPLSREVLLPWMVTPADSFAALAVVPEKHSPLTAARLLQPFSGVSKTSLCRSRAGPEEGTVRSIPGTAHTRPFRSREEYRSFLRSFARENCPAEIVRESCQRVSIFLSSLTENSLLFDLGYSGRIPEAVCRAAGRRVPFLFLLGEAGASCRVTDASGTPVDLTVLLPLADTSCGPLLEYLSAANGGHFEGLSEDGKTGKSEDNNPAESVFLRASIQRAALQYVRDWCCCFGEQSAFLLPPLEYAALPAIDFLQNFPESEQDRVLFEPAGIDDRFYAASEWVPVLSLYPGHKQEWDNESSEKWGENDDSLKERKIFRKVFRQESLPYRAWNVWKEDPALFLRKIIDRCIPI